MIVAALFAVALADEAYPAPAYPAPAYPAPAYPAPAYPKPAAYDYVSIILFLKCATLKIQYGVAKLKCNRISNKTNIGIYFMNIPSQQIDQL